MGPFFHPQFLKGMVVPSLYNAWAGGELNAMQAGGGMAQRP
jgi:hypothetical protein